MNIHRFFVYRNALHVEVVDVRFEDVNRVLRLIWTALSVVDANLSKCAARSWKIISELHKPNVMTLNWYNPHLV